jgi:hypothetical protein
MSTSPTRYYASRPSSRSTSRPTSPPSAAEVRSQAVAKLKRAASLPRTPAGRRPSTRQAVNDDAQGAQDTAPLTTDLNQPGPSTYQHSQAGQDTQEMLSPSPINSSFDHNAIYAHAQALQMQRSASASSSFHMPTPPHLGMSQGAPYFPASPSPALNHTSLRCHPFLSEEAPSSLVSRLCRDRDETRRVLCRLWAS